MARGIALAAVGARRFSDTLASKLAALAASLANAARLGAQGETPSFKQGSPYMHIFPDSRLRPPLWGGRGRESGNICI